MTAMLPHNACFSDAELTQLTLGEINDAYLPRMQAHLDTCPRCLRRLEQCAASDPLMAAMKGGDSQATPYQPVTPHVQQLIERLQALPPNQRRATANQASANWQGVKTITDSRYVIDQEIARGGMGAVVRAVDCDIRREVAIKFMLDETDDDKKVRFVEEAQITGQLEHPNIVPIHELGLDAEKRLFFAMKLVNGRSLAEILDRLRKEPAAEVEWPLSKLLTILVNVSHALSYAHSRGVIHRDLKPANIMVGDFGEVYVMDWGLAKIMGQKSPAGEAPTAATNAHPSTATSVPSLSPDRTQQILTNRELAGELTQDGAIIGTPLYMPPEQARGEIHTLDARSDLYSLGAMLYEFLTLLPPVEKAGGNVSILQRVAEGRIQPPAERTPSRAKQGKIPNELAAIALKALALKPTDRYGSCEFLRRDLELFQEGRSVSAKQDTAVELLQKLIKRNKGASIAIATAAVILLAFATIFLKLNRDARLVAEAHQRTAETQKKIAVEQKQAAENQRQIAESQRTLAVAAKAEMDKAYSQFRDEQNAKEQVIRRSIPAMLRAARQLANEGKVTDAAEQVHLAQTYATEEPEVRLLKGEILLSKREWTAARIELQFYLKRQPDNTVAQELWKQLPEDSPPDNPRIFLIAEQLKQQHLSGLAVPLLADVARDAKTRQPLVDLYNQQVEANWPGLKGRVKLEQDGRIKLSFRLLKEISDLSPLQGMQLDELNLDGCHNVFDIKPLTGMPLKSLNIYGCVQIESIEPLRGMPLTTLNLNGLSKIKDFSPLRGMKLTNLDLSNCRNLSDLDLLWQMPLTDLRAQGLPISSLEPLRGMKLEFLSLSGCNFVTDLTPLTGMPLKQLNADYCRIDDLTPLQGMPLELAVLTGDFRDLTPLAGMPLKDLVLSSRNVTDLSILNGMPLQRLSIGVTTVTDLSPLEGLELQFIGFDVPKISRGIETLRNMKSLTTIYRYTPTKYYAYTPAEFWQRYDAGEFNEKK